MVRTLLGRLASIVVLAVLAFGAVAAADTPSLAQLTVTCWKEYCTRDPDTGKQYCVKEEITCPQKQ